MDGRRTSFGQHSRAGHALVGVGEAELLGRLLVMRDVGGRWWRKKLARLWKDSRRAGAFPELHPTASVSDARALLHANRSDERICTVLVPTPVAHERLISARMPADRLLSTLLRSLQTYTDQQDTPRYACPPACDNRD